MQTLQTAPCRPERAEKRTLENLSKIKEVYAHHWSAIRQRVKAGVDEAKVLVEKALAANSSEV
jgi:hypothetical protein